MKYKKENDYELIYMIRENDNDSYNQLLNKYRPIIKRLSYSYYTKYKSYGADLDDFLQESYISFHNAVINFNEKKDALFYTFVTICINRSLMSYCRKITNDKKNISSSLLVDIDDCNVIEESNVYNYLSYKDNLKEINNFLLDLDFYDSCVVKLRIGGFSYHEISILLDLPLRTVQFKASKVRKRYKRQENV